MPSSRLESEADLKGRYVLGAEIARGGIGVVREAHDLLLGREVAVKVLLTASSDAEELRRFMHEARVLAQLPHPNIVPIHDTSGGSDSVPFYAMKRIRGHTLQQILDGLREGDSTLARDYSLDRLLTVFRKVCDAVAFAHSHRVLHRDLKPENVMVGEFGEVQVMDWGLAKRMGDSSETLGDADSGESNPLFGSASQTLHGEVMGTPQYMAPEQAAGRISEHDERTDVFALGGILYAMLTLRPPIRGRTVQEALSLATSGHILPPTGYGQSRRGDRGGDDGTLDEMSLPLPHCANGRVPKALSAVAMRALSKERDARYPSVGELAAEIESYQNGFATRAERASVGQQVWLLLRRHRAVAAASCALFLVASVFGTHSLIAGRRAEKALMDLRNTAPVLRQLADSEASFGRFESALEKLKVAEDLEPEAVDVYWQRAWILMGMQRWSEAAAALERATEKDPEHRDRAAILPVIGDLVGLPESEDWPKRTISMLTDHLVKVGASSALAALAVKLRLEAEPRRKLVADRARAWLGDVAASRVAIEEQGRVRLDLNRLDIDSLEPLRGLPLDGLNLYRTRVSSLEPLVGMQLSRIELAETLVADLSPLQGMPLEIINITGSQVTDLEPLRGAPLEHISAWGVKAEAIDVLTGAPLRVAQFHGNGFRDLEFLRGAPLTNLDFNTNQVADLSPLRGMPLKSLRMESNRVTDLSPLKGMPITDLRMEGNPIEDITPLLDMPHLERVRMHPPRSGLSVLRRHPTLKFVALFQQGSYRPVKEIWEEEDRANLVKNELSARRARVETELKRLLGSEEGLEVKVVNEDEISVRLRTVQAADLENIRDLPFDQLHVPGTGVESIEALRGLRLTELDLNGGKVTDLSPLVGMPLRVLRLHNVGGEDLSLLKGLPLQTLVISGRPRLDLRWVDWAKLRALDMSATQMSDLSILRDANLEVLVAHGNQLTDLSPLAGKKLTRLLVGNNEIRELAPLSGLPLVDLEIQNNPVTSLQPLMDVTTLRKLRVTASLELMAALRKHPSLSEVAGAPPSLYRPVAEVWKELEAWDKESKSKP